MQRHGQYPRYINDIPPKQVIVKNKGLELYSPGSIWNLCRDIREELQRCSCNGYREECQLDMKNLQKCKCEKTAVYDLLRTGMVGGPAHVFTRYHEKNITHTCMKKKAH